ncbi:hypothetical protein BR93DRAFT_489954 [Coniochaeta sp. PMI_546]|nr:hypothetical protein BR93DRAFT_489954 [Coniochaeta sp. PMI_546]
MHRTLYVLVYPSRLFAAHWSLWIPYLDSSGQESDTGDRVHVTGDRLNGFQYEYLRDYNVREDERKPNSFPVGSISGDSLRDWREDGDEKSGSDAMRYEGVNLFDRVCREVEAPGPSLNKVTKLTLAQTTGPPPRKTEVKDCQWWLKQAVEHLVEGDILMPLEEALGDGTPVERVMRLPRH